MNPTPNGVQKSFCTTREASALLGVSVGTIQKWVASGVLMAWKTSGGHRRVMRQSVEALLHKRVHSTDVIVASAGRRLDDQRRLRIMVVSGDTALLRQCTSALAQWASWPEVIAVSNPTTALVMMGSKCPDLLLIDLKTPDINWGIALRALKNAPEMRQITVVALAHAADGMQSELGGIPVDIEVVPDPVSFDRLRTIADRIVSQRPLDFIRT